MRVAFFEDREVAQLHPLTLARPVFELVCGRDCLRERIIRHCRVTEWGVFVRDHLVDTYREQFPEAHVNDFVWLSAAPTIAINGCWLPSAEAVHALPTWEGAGLIDGRVAAIVLEPFDAGLLMRSGWESTLVELARTRRTGEPGGRWIEYPWDLVSFNVDQLCEDFRLAGLPAHRFEPTSQIGVIGNAGDLHIDPAARIDPFVVFDVTEGPIGVAAGAVIKSFTQLAGPCQIGHGTQLLAAQIRGGTTIGPQSRVGGEVEASILHGYVNKYHAGFLGHSYVCPWVNLGALATTSDLKNDYSSVHVPLGGDSIDSGLTKLGCFIGDHTKAAIGTLLNTGTTVGVMSMLLPDGKLLPKHIPSFCRMWHGELSDEVDLDQTLHAARIAMGRRNVVMTAADERLWRLLHVQTRVEREDAILRARDRAFSRESYPR